MRRSLLIILAGVGYFLGVSVCWADDPDVAYPSESHVQLVNQELDRVEANTNNYNQTTVPQPQPPPPPAQNIPVVQEPVSLIPHRNEISAAPEFYWINFFQPKVLAQKGLMAGYNAQFTHRFSDDPDIYLNMFRFQGQWTTGKLKTVPIDQGPSGIKASSYELRALLGKDSYSIAHMRATGYTGFGYRNFEDNAAGLDTLQGNFTLLGYKSFSTYCYLPVGADLVYQAHPGYSIESNLEYDYVFKDWQEDKLGVVPGFNNLNVNDRGGNGVRASLRLNLNFKSCTAFVEGFYRYWSITKSKSEPDPNDPGGTLNVPKNSTQEYGLRLGLQI